MAEESGIRDRLTATRQLGGPERVTIYWEKKRGADTWLAHRILTGQPHARMRELDADDMLSVFKFMRDVLTGNLDEELLMG